MNNNEELLALLCLEKIKHLENKILLLEKQVADQQIKISKLINDVISTCDTSLDDLEKLLTSNQEHQKLFNNFIINHPNNQN